MKRLSKALGIISCFLLSGCELGSEDIRVYSFSFEFSNADEGWSGDFADYPEGDSILYGLEVNHEALPENISKTRKGIKITGTNHSDDLFMFIKRKLSGLQPNTTYSVLFSVRFASNVPTGSPGIGGAPGESVYVKAGATRVEPVKVLANNYFEMNIDKGQQSQGGTDMQVIGHIGVAATTTQYAEVYRNNTTQSSFKVTANNQGEVWIIVGTDSGFEGTTTLYYTGVDILFNQVD
jgi:hypothetical protein